MNCFVKQTELRTFLWLLGVRKMFVSCAVPVVPARSPSAGPEREPELVHTTLCNALLRAHARLGAPCRCRAGTRARITETCQMCVVSA